MDYDKINKESCAAFNAQNQEFRNKFNIDGYTNWYYHQASGIFTFSTENSEINFRYLEIGSYSLKARTWKWSWDNEWTLKKVKADINKVKEYGIENGFAKLYEGTFESREEEGWEFLSIANHILNGQGGYRAKTEKLLSFVLFFEKVDNNKAKSEKAKFIECIDHSLKRRAFVCQHLSQNSKNGFHEAFETYKNMEFEYEEDDFQAWCNKCEKARLATNGWTDKSMEIADINLVCEECYFEIKEQSVK